MTKNEIYWEISVCKNNLKATDYKAIKYAEGAMTEAEFESDKAKRAVWREQINAYQKMIEDGEYEETIDIDDFDTADPNSRDDGGEE